MVFFVHVYLVPMSPTFSKKVVLVETITCGATGCAAFGAARWELTVTTFSLQVSFDAGVVDFNEARLATLVLVAMSVMTLVYLDPSAVRVAVFDLYLTEGVVE